MNWTLFWQIAGSITGIAGIIIAIVLFIVSRREKIEVTYSSISVRLLETDGTINGLTVECAFGLLYSKGTREHYISETRLELDKQAWRKLRLYFDKLPRRVGGIPCSEGLKELKRGKPETFGIDFSSKASRVITEDAREELDDLIQQLWYRYRIGWKDTYRKKVRWKTINQLKELQKRGTM